MATGRVAPIERAGCTRRRWLLAATISLAGAVALPGWAQDAAVRPSAAGQGTRPPAVAPGAPAVSPRARQALEQRVALLAKELGLDEHQQSEVRRILLEQRAEIARIWADESQPPGQRIAATQAVGDRTGDKIRALLSDRQRERYNKARPATPAEPPNPEVEEWITRTGAH